MMFAIILVAAEATFRLLPLLAIAGVVRAESAKNWRQPEIQN